MGHQVFFAGEVDAVARVDLEDGNEVTGKRNTECVPMPTAFGTAIALTLKVLPLMTVRHG